MVTGVGTVAQPTAAMGGSSQTEGGLPTVRRASDNRRSNKPIMEKRRRARINNCLNELKTLILDAMKKDPARHSKLEKADILEMTVKHLETLQRRQAGDASTDKFRAGFSECAGEVGRFPGLEPAVRRRLLQHLASCLSGANKTEVTSSPTTSPTPATALQVHILPTPPAGENVAPSQGILFTNGNGASVQLVPTRLPNGDIALVLPASLPQSPISPASSSSSGSSATPPSPLPVLVPIPPRTSAPAPHPPQTQSQQSHSVPLALVVRKTAPQEHDKPCWRPW